jgi:hypothetical protein
MILYGPAYITSPLLGGHAIIDTSIIHDTLAVIAIEVKQSSKTKRHFV